MSDAPVEQPLFLTQRKKIINAYVQAKEPFSASTKPYKSTVSYSFRFANPIVASSTVWYIASQGQQYDWFSYKIGDQVPGNTTGAYASPYRSATEADTNISKARTTNGAEDFVIEGMSCSHRSVRADFSSVTEDQNIVPNITDTTVAQCLGGNVPISDPGALYLPPQCMSPFNLEDALFRALIGHISVEFEWDRSKTVKIGTLEQIPEGAANSYLRASGEPSTNDRYRIPEGYLWRREGQPDSEFITRGTLTEPVCMPMLAVLSPATTTPLLIYPTTIFIDVCMRLHGLSVKLPTRN